MSLSLSQLLFLLTSFITLWITHLIVSSILSLLKNRRLAIVSGLPYVLVPYFEINIICGLLARTPISPLVVDRLLPDRWTRWKRFVRPDWRFRGGYDQTHGEKGDVLLVVSPGGIVCNIADAAVAHEVLQRRNEFVKMQKVLGKSDHDQLKSMQAVTDICRLVVQSALYGENVLTVRCLRLQNAARSAFRV
jgi:hypothetical protein